MTFESLHHHLSHLQEAKMRRGACPKSDFFFFLGEDFRDRLAGWLEDCVTVASQLGQELTPMFQLCL